MQCTTVQALDAHEPTIGFENMAIRPDLENNDETNAADEAEEYAERYDPENPEINNDDTGINDFEEFLNQ